MYWGLWGGAYGGVSGRLDSLENIWNYVELKDYKLKKINWCILSTNVTGNRDQLKGAANGGASKRDTQWLRNTRCLFPDCLLSEWKAHRPRWVWSPSPWGWLLFSSLLDIDHYCGSPERIQRMWPLWMWHSTSGKQALGLVEVCKVSL